MNTGSASLASCTGGARALAFVVCALATAFASGPAFAAGQRSFVSGTGSDSGTCTISAPCRSFGVAITNTNSGGEIIALDSAGYGAVTINKSISIIAPPGVYAGVSVFAGQDGVTIDGPAIAVTLRGLFINGQGGRHGIYMVQGTKLNVESCEISGMTQNGVSIELNLAEVHVDDTMARSNGGSGFAFIGQSKATLSRVRGESNAADGIVAIDGANVSVSDSVLVKNGANGIRVASDKGFVSTARLAVTRSDISQNVNGVLAQTAGAATNHVLSWISDSQIGMNTLEQVKLDAADQTIVNMSLIGNRLNGDDMSITAAGTTGQAILIVGLNYGPNTACTVVGSGAGILSYLNNGLSCFFSPTNQAVY